jgi:hypothetical protein
MPDHRKAILFVIIFFLSYGILMSLLSLQGVKSGLHTFYKNSSTRFTSLLLTRLDIQSQFERVGTKTSYDQFNIRIVANQEEIDRRIAEARQKRLKQINNPDCYGISFIVSEFYTVPLVFLFSLLIATPAAPRKRILNLGIGVFAMLLYLWLNFLIKIIYSINFICPYDMEMYVLGSTGRSTVEFLTQAMTLGFKIILGVVIWLSLSYKSLPIREWSQSLK